MNRIAIYLRRLAALCIAVFAVGFVLGFALPASAHAAGDINCAHPAQGPEEECIEDVLAMPHQVEDPIGRVVYSAPRCYHLILKDYDADSFVLAEYLRGKNSDKPHRGYEVHRKLDGFSRTFEADTWTKYRIGYDFVRLSVEQTGLTAKDAVSAYVNACAR
ncbi:MAG: hypothetical protein RLO51_11220 [Thalassobaculum sp.]|uniref:hypothetical protein n=1 Tax=Thalassobaculum sp. TaxID=2022740 RepID=UPI0032EF25C9